MTATLTGMRMTPAVRRITIAIIAIAALCATTAHAANSQPSSPNDVDATPVFRHASLKYAKSGRVFPSSEVSHLEPVLGYTLRHEDNLALHTQHAAGQMPPHQFKTYADNAANSLGAHSMKMRSLNGLDQPFPNEVSMSFHAFGLHFDLPNMPIQNQLYVENSKTQVHTADGTIEIPNVLQTYHYSSRERGIDGVVTLLQDGRFHAVLNVAEVDGTTETYQFDPLHAHASSTDEHVFSSLSAAAEHGVVAYKHSDLKITKDSHQCGAMQPPKEGEEATAEPEIHIDAMPSASQRRLMAAFGEGVTSCYTGDTSAQKISTGVGADFGFYTLFGSTTATQAYISSIYSIVNLIYLAQFNVYIQVDLVIIHSSADGGATWNLYPVAPATRCTTDIAADLGLLTAWRQSVQPKRDSIWHVFTNCYPPAGTVGLAYVGVICSSNYGTGVSSYSVSMWLTVAHEVGHNFGGNHAFQLGQGTTGGIMDYGDGQYPIGSGIYQFNEVYNKAEMCKQLKSGLALTGITPFCSAAYTPTCGNNVREAGEDCDDSTSCCVNCKFKTGGVCSPGVDNSNTCCDDTCQYKATTTSCGLSANGVLQGYCSNGVCTDSTCNAYSNLKYCGMVANNPCKQTCLYNSACTSAFSTPNLVVPDGVVCSTSTYSTCVSGVCVATTQPVTYSWVTSNPTTCSCSGILTVTVQCVDSKGVVSADSLCTSTKPSTTQTCTAPSSCVQWQEGGFGACSVDCGSGTQTQSVQCVQVASPTTVVANSLCAGQTQPASSRTCTQSACPVAWVAGGWGACSKSCGSGVQTQTVTCMQTQNGAKSTVADTTCTGTKPLTQQACNTQSCTDGLSWSYGAFGACSVTCGGGIQTRSATCMQNNVATTASVCAAIAGSMVTSQTCNTNLCPVRVWRTGSYGTCSLTCGGGTQTRTVQCFDQANDPNFLTPLADALCTDTKPVSIALCNTQVCPSTVTLVWYTSAWSACSADCKSGGGVTTRTVTCVNQYDEARVNQGDAACAASTTAGTKPASSQACNNQGCSTYELLAGDWGSCSVQCGGGIQTRSLVCRDSLSQAIVDTSLCGTSNVATSMACNTQSCATTGGSWQAGEWSVCSKVCGSGTRSRLVTCVDQSGATLADSACTATKPLTTGACATQTCGTYWYTGDFSACSATCGASGGTQTRKVSCLYLTDNPLTATPLAASACSSTKPSTQVVCNQFPCPTYVPADTWSSCSARCGTGVQTRNVTCQSYDGRVLSNSLCSTASMPVVQQVCRDQLCPHWHRGEWGLCSQTCGGGIQNRTLECRMPHDNTTFGALQPDTSLCPLVGVGDVGDGAGLPGVTAGKPISSQACQTAACAANYWRITAWSACSATCGPNGVTTSTATCTSKSTGLAVAESLCTTAQPNTTVSCNTNIPCGVYEWRAQAWGACGAYCGSSTQTRAVYCFNTNVDSTMLQPIVRVDASFCEAAGLEKPAVQQACQSNPPEVCWGRSQAFPDVVNGRCTDGQCVCRSGSVGASCASIGNVTNVKTNGAQFSAGIPIGEPLIITWTSDVTSLPYVNIVLLKSFTGLAANTTKVGGEWAIGEYLGSNIVNSGTFQWQVGSQLSDLEFGSGFRVRVWYSKNLYADSPVFAIADPCAYKTCGSNGNCQLGKCVCLNGWTGDTCQTGPCERAGCSATSSNCSNVALVTTPPGVTTAAAVCAPFCKAGYSGAQCKTPAICSSVVSCGANGDLDLTTAVVTSTSCSGQCACTGSWSGSACSVCSLGCQNGGTADSTCATCTCPAGFTGTKCACKYYLFSMTFNMDWSAWSSDSVAVARFGRTVATDVQIAALAASPTSSTTVSTESVTFPETGKVVATVRFSLACEDVSARAAAAAQAQLAATDATKAQAYTGAAYLQRMEAAAATASASASTPTLIETYNALLPLFQDMDSALWQGQATVYLDSSSRVSTVDPTGQDSLAQPASGTDCFVNTCSGTSQDDDSSSSSSTVALAVGIAIAVVVVLIIAAIGFYCWRKKRVPSHYATNRMSMHEITMNPMTTSQY